MNILYVWDALGIHTMVVCKAATLFVKFCRGKRCPSETSCQRAKLYVCVFLIVGVQRQPSGARDRVLKSESHLSFFFLPFPLSEIAFNVGAWSTSVHNTPVSCSRLLHSWTPFFSATLLHVYMGFSILLLYTTALSADARRSQTVKCFSYFSSLEGMTRLSCWDLLATAGAIKSVQYCSKRLLHIALLRPWDVWETVLTAWPCISGTANFWFVYVKILYIGKNA